MKRCTCKICGKTKNITDFYAISEPNPKYPDNVLDICKTCLLQRFDPDDPNTFIPIFREIDIAWIPAIYRQTYEKNLTTNGSRTTVLGRYISRMKLGQYANFHFADSEKAQAYYSSTDPYDDPMKYPGAKTPLGEVTLFSDPSAAQRLHLPTYSDGPFIAPGADIENSSIAAPEGAAMAGNIVLTKEELTYLLTKWGKDFDAEQLVRLERQYLKMLQDFDIRTETQKDYLRKMCVVSLRYDEALSQNLSDDARRWSAMYSDLTKQSGFQPIQKNEVKPDYMDSIGALVRMAESKEFIPKWDTSEPKDKLDVILKDYQLFLKRTLLNDPTILDKIDEAVTDLKKQDQLIANRDFGDSDSEDEEQLIGINDNIQATVDDPTANLFEAYNSVLDDDYDIKTELAPIIEKKNNNEELSPLEQATLALKTVELTQRRNKRKNGKH